MNTQNTDNDDTGARIHAFLASMKPCVNGQFVPEEQAAFDRGRFAVVQMAAIARNTDDAPGIIFPPSTCADVLSFLSKVCPVEPRDWWVDSKDVSHVCGLMFVLMTLEESIRRRVPGSAASILGVAIAETERLYQDADEGSDDETRYSEALTDLKSALDLLQWRAPS
jgi:hypothetical protein